MPVGSAQGRRRPGFGRRPGLHHGRERPGPGAEFRVLRLRVAPPAHWVHELRGLQPTRVRVLHCEPREATGRVLRLVELVARGEDSPRVTEFLGRRLQPSSSWEALDPPGSFLVWSTEPAPVTCRFAHRLGAICLSCPVSDEVGDDGRTSWDLLVRLGRRSLERSLRPAALAQHGLGGATFEGIRAFEDASTVTPRQERAVAMALQIGYFEVPRRGGLPELAASLGVRRSAAQELLRRGLAKVLEHREEPGRLG